MLAASNAHILSRRPSSVPSGGHPRLLGPVSLRFFGLSCLAGAPRVLVLAVLVLAVLVLAVLVLGDGEIGDRAQATFLGGGGGGGRRNCGSRGERTGWCFGCVRSLWGSLDGEWSGYLG